jgi:hypothetical protein
MRDRRRLREVRSWLGQWQPHVGWLVVAALYLVAAVLTVMLAVAMGAWGLWLVTAALALAAGGCLLIGFDHQRPHQPGVTGQPTPYPHRRINIRSPPLSCDQWRIPVGGRADGTKTELVKVRPANNWRKIVRRDRERGLAETTLATPR